MLAPTPVAPVGVASAASQLGATVVDHRAFGIGADLRFWSRCTCPGAQAGQGGNHHRESGRFLTFAQHLLDELGAVSAKSRTTGASRSFPAASSRRRISSPARDLWQLLRAFRQLSVGLDALSFFVGPAEQLPDRLDVGPDGVLGERQSPLAGLLQQFGGVAVEQPAGELSWLSDSLPGAPGQESCR
jgi:hypothetical protein